MTDTATPTKLKLTEVEVVKDFNPRTTMDKQKLDELAKSIKENGLIQPIVVGDKNDKGKYPLIAGHRRYAALKQNRAKEVDVRLISANGNAKALAVTENLQREAVNPIDEAKGFAQVMETEGINQKQLATRLGISTSQVSHRLKLLKLPEGPQSDIASGKVPASAAPLLAKIAQVSGAASSVASGLIADGEYDASSLDSRPDVIGEFMRAISAAVGEGLPCWVNLNNIYHLRRGLWIDEDPDALTVVKAVEDARHDWASPSRPGFETEDITAAKAYGCLVEIKAGQHTYYYATDIAFVLDRLKLKLERHEQAKADRAKTQKGSAASSDSDKERRALEREKQRVARIAANGHNVELGRNMVEQLQSLDVTLERLRVLCLIIAHEIPDVPLGRVLTDENQADFEQKFRKSDGQESIKITPLPVTSVRELFLSDIIEADTPEALMAVMFEAFIAQKFGRFDALAGNDQWNYHWNIPSGSYDAPLAQDPTIEIARVALDVVSGETREQIEQLLKDVDTMAAAGDEEGATTAADDLREFDVDNPRPTDPDAEALATDAGIDGGGSDFADGGSDDDRGLSD